MYTPDYFVLTQIIIDDIYFPDGRSMQNQMGGGAYTAAGLRCWSEKVAMCSGVGTDFSGNYDEWFNNNGIYVAGASRDALCTHSRINYFPDGEREELLIPGYGDHRLMQAEFNEIPESFAGAKGMYLFKNCEESYWNNAKQYLRKNSMVSMWEIMGSDAVPEKRDHIADYLSLTELFSLNISEGRRLCGKDEPADILKALHDMHAKTVLLRMGVNGALVSDGRKAYHIPAAETIVADVTGGGNASTGGFLAGWCESGGDVARAGVCAAVSAAFIIAQYSVPPCIDTEMMKKAEAMADALKITMI